MRGEGKSGEEPEPTRSKGPEVGRETREERGRWGGLAGGAGRGGPNCLDLGFVRVCSGRYDKIPPTGWLVNNRKFFSFWRLRVQDGAPTWSVLVGTPRCRPRPHGEDGRGEGLCASFMRRHPHSLGPTPTAQAPPSGPTS